MKKVHQYEYDNLLKSIEKLEEDLAEVRRYKGEVAIYQGDNWHDNPILYQTELKETALMAQIRNLREELYSLEIIKERTSEMINLEEILNPNIVKDSTLSEEKKLQIKTKQDLIIKYPIDGKVIVNGIDGSGIEDTLLYRVAYLICSTDNNIDSRDILMLNPNEIYSKIISEELTKFITDDITQKSILSFASEYLNEKLSLYKADDNSENLKSSEEYNKLIEEFVTSYLGGRIVTDDLKICDEVLFSKDEIRHALFSYNKLIPNYDWASMYFVNQYKNKFQILSDKITKKYTDIYMSLPFENPKRKEYVAKANEIRKVFKEKGSKIIKDYFKKLNRKTTDVYALFISELDTLMNDKDKSLLKFQSETLKMLKKHRVSVADVSALLYIRYLLTNDTIKQKNVIVNESQYYCESLISILQKILPKSGFTVFSRNKEYKLEKENFEVVNLNEKYDNTSFDIEKFKDPTVKIKQLKNSN